MSKLTTLTISILATAIGICPGVLPAQAQDGGIPSGKTCRVTDPTGTPLNARLQPNGKIVNRIRNGRTVYAQSIARDDEGKPWVLVAIKNQGNYKILGYVLREFVSCY
ncbi:SH3 domain-containing protein [Chamaesiphon sp. VAR_48_metabat_403]|uniref:SH3 domain-containing protein n=1 Tax=Chamaesiphon sp. VAR_48_metabat_403 TaxID=2964700 RepID=UPI00286E2126|nr:SH3 domain-containing protein [Chamaesiphon sp. VAR_48_metabat_403]